MSLEYGINEIRDIVFVDSKTGESFPVVPMELPTPIEPVYYLVKLDRKVSDIHHKYFNSIGISVFISNIEDQPNWMVVKVYRPYKVSSITDLEHVIDAMEVRIELG